MNQVYQGIDMDMPMQYSKHLAIISSVLIYSGPVPLMILMLPVYLGAQYWLEKFLSKLL